MALSSFDKALTRLALKATFVFPAAGCSKLYETMNPLGLDAVDDVVTSVGNVDTRQPVTLADNFAHGVGRLLINHGPRTGRCSATIVDIDFLSDITEDPNTHAILTAAHCVEEFLDPTIREEYMVGLSKGIIEFHGVYPENDFTIGSYQLDVAGFWAPYNYFEPDGRGNFDNDFAILIAKGELPESVTPLKIYENARMGVEEGGQITSYGYSADARGLHKDTCYVTDLDPKPATRLEFPPFPGTTRVRVNEPHPPRAGRIIETNCDVAKGASGGPILYSFGPYPKVIGVNSTVKPGTDTSNFSAIDLDPLRNFIRKQSPILH